MISDVLESHILQLGIKFVVLGDHLIVLQNLLGYHLLSLLGITS